MMMLMMFAEKKSIQMFNNHKTLKQINKKKLLKGTMILPLSTIMVFCNSY
jgi:hypothetical protein